jgi:hypothetical protein
MSQVSPETFRALGVQSEPSTSNGQFVHVATGAVVTVKDSEIVDVHDVSLHCREFEDFLGNVDLPSTGDTVINAGTPWFVYDKSDAGSATKAASADADSGVYSIGAAANDEVEAVVINWGDNRGIDPAQGPVMTCRLTTSAIGLATDKFVFGFASDHADDPDSVASNAWFCVAGASNRLLVESDNGVTDNDDDDTGVDLVPTTHYEYKIDASNYAAVKFYYRATLGGTWIDVTPAGTTYALHASTSLQPYIHAGKSGGVGTPTLLVDYVDVVWKRN